MSIITGIVKNGVIIPKEKIRLREHQEVKILIAKKYKHSIINQIAKEIEKKKPTPHAIVEQIIESSEYGEGID